MFTFFLLKKWRPSAKGATCLLIHHGVLIGRALRGAMAPVVTAKRSGDVVITLHSRGIARIFAFSSFPK
jgi:hypothetical protein